LRIHYFNLFILFLVPAGCDKSNPGEPAGSIVSRDTQPATTASADNQTASDDEQKLLGTWVAEDVDAKIGSVKIKLTFRQENSMKLAAWSDIPFVGQMRDKTSSYEVNGNVISASAIGDGTSVEYWFDGDDLMIKYKEGKTIRFHRT